MLEAFVAWIRGSLTGFVSGLNAMVPGVPPEVGQACSVVSGAVAWLRPALSFLPVGSIGLGLGIVILCVLAGFGIVVARIVASFLTLGGGGV